MSLIRLPPRALSPTRDLLRQMYFGPDDEVWHGRNRHGRKEREGQRGETQMEFLSTLFRCRYNNDSFLRFYLYEQGCVMFSFLIELG